jgi:hypothetical protein
MDRHTRKLVNALAAGAVIGGLAAGVWSLHAVFQSKIHGLTCMANQIQVGVAWRK